MPFVTQAIQLFSNRPSSPDYRTTGDRALYNLRTNFNTKQGRFYPAETGYYLCNANARLDNNGGSFMKLKIAYDGDYNTQNGLETISGDGWLVWLIINSNFDCSSMIGGSG